MTVLTSALFILSVALPAASVSAPPPVPAPASLPNAIVAAPAPVPAPASLPNAIVAAPVNGCFVLTRLLFNATCESCNGLIMPNETAVCGNNSVQTTCDAVVCQNANTTVNITCVGYLSAPTDAQVARAQAAFDNGPGVSSESYNTQFEAWLSRTQGVSYVVERCQSGCADWDPDVVRVTVCYGGTPANVTDCFADALEARRCNDVKCYLGGVLVPCADSKGSNKKLLLLLLLLLIIVPVCCSALLCSALLAALGVRRTRTSAPIPVAVGETIGTWIAPVSEVVYATPAPGSQGYVSQTPALVY